MKLRKEIQWNREAQPFGFLVDPRVGEVHGLNETSNALLEALQDGCEESELCAILRARFDVGEIAAQQDVQAFVDVLRRNDLVEF
ncbi:MAG: PqqD family protein [Planctomycetes bacterium]|nr:PqqD family protein [Planctomycetota bacterium]